MDSHSHEITTRSSLSMQLPAATQSRPSCQIMLAHHHHRSSSSIFLRLILSFTQPYYSYNHQPLASYVVSNSSWLLVRWPMASRYTVVDGRRAGHTRARTGTARSIDRARRRRRRGARGRHQLIIAAIPCGAGARPIICWWRSTARGAEPH